MNFTTLFDITSHYLGGARSMAALLSASNSSLSTHTWRNKRLRTTWTWWRRREFSSITSNKEDWQENKVCYLESGLKTIALSPGEAHPRLRHLERHPPAHLHRMQLWVDKMMLWLAILFAKNGMFLAMYLNLDGTLGISSLLSGDNGDVRTNRVGRVEVGRQLWYFGIRLVMMIHRIANKMVEVGRKLWFFYDDSYLWLHSYKLMGGDRCEDVNSNWDIFKGTWQVKTS